MLWWSLLKVTYRPPMTRKLRNKSGSAPESSRSGRITLAPAAPRSSEVPSRSTEASDNVGIPGFSLRLALGCGCGRRPHSRRIRLHRAVIPVQLPGAARKSKYRRQLWTVRDVVQRDGRRAISLRRSTNVRLSESARDTRQASPPTNLRHLVFVSPQPGRWIRLF